MGLERGWPGRMQSRHLNDSIVQRKPLGPFLVICSGAAVDGETPKEHEGGKARKKGAGAYAWGWLVQQE